MAKISPSHLGLALATYVEQDMYPQAEGFDKVFLAAAVLALPNKAPQMVEEFRPMLEFLDLWTPENMIELDSLYQQLQAAFQKTGPIKYKGFGFSGQDVEKLYAIARSFAQ